MLLGLVTDIHNDAASLSRALALFRQHRVDQVVTLGDSLDPVSAIRGEDAVADLLRDAGTIGVWGNHDMALCINITETARTRFPGVLDYMATLRPWLEIADCRLSHEEAGIDPYDLMAMWIMEGPLDLTVKARSAFATTGQRVQFVGHYHRWWIGSEEGPLDWRGAASIALSPPGRYFVVVAAVVDGWCATYDTTTGQLQPLPCGETAG